MQRRSLLVLVAGGLATAGCGSDSPDPSAPSDSAQSPAPSTETGTATPTSGPDSASGTPTERTVDAASVDRIRVARFPPDVPLEGTVEVSETSSDCAVAVNATISNRDDERHVLYSGGNYELPFGTLTAADGENELVLEALRETPPSMTDGTCPRTTPRSYGASARESLAPSASVSNRALVMDRAGNDPSFPPGRYRFRTGYRLDPEEVDRQFDWGFTLFVE